MSKTKNKSGKSGKSGNKNLISINDLSLDEIKQIFAKASNYLTKNQSDNKYSQL